MVTFRSEVFPDFFSDKINYSDRILFFGSCFAENIGNKLIELKFKVFSNPFGILYNPASIAQSLDFILCGKLFEAADLEYYNEKWISFFHHGKFSSGSMETVLENINLELEKAMSFLKSSGFLFITFGTSWVYMLNKTLKIVANCHKLPSGEFMHYSLSTENIKELYRPLISRIHEFNKDLRIIFTVSPVRHWKNGPVQNQYSKSVLILSIHDLAKEFDFISYFPSYEIMMDDLRDYRFYSEDLFHPNQTGIDYIWNKFRDCYLSEKAIIVSEKVEKLIKSMHHRVFYPTAPAYKMFLENNLQIINELQLNYPELELDSECNYFRGELRKYFNL